MNPAAFGSLPGSACTLGSAGSFGADRITRNVYDDAGQLLRVQRANGNRTSLRKRDGKTLTYQRVLHRADYLLGEIDPPDVPLLMMSTSTAARVVFRGRAAAQAV